MNNKNISMLSDPRRFQAMQDAYLAVRKCEGWLSSDEELMQLPFVPASHPHARIWRWRQRTLQRLIRYLNGKQTSEHMRIADIGCGNGWMSHRLAKTLKAETWAIDINLEELKQGSRVFEAPELQFCFADIRENVLPTASFDIVVVAGAIQYFDNLEHSIACMRRLLRPGGEIHLIDSNFYISEHAVEKARKATIQYYQQLGAPGMIPYYHHHLKKAVIEAGGEDLNNTLTYNILKKIRFHSPFPWIRIAV